MQLVLASQSRYRAAQLQSFGIPFTLQRPRVDEEQLKRQGPKDPVELTKFLALKKAESLKHDYENAVILGADQIAEMGGERLDKPGNAEKAVEQLRKMQGKSHRLITSIAVVSPLKTIERTDITTLTLRKLTDAEIHAYVAADQPFDCAGSYKIESKGLALMEHLQTQDPSAIQGLPMIALSHALIELGLNVTELWSRK